jgi:hypothetical protein
MSLGIILGEGYTTEEIRCPGWKWLLVDPTILGYSHHHLTNKEGCEAMMYKSEDVSRTYHSLFTRDASVHWKRFTYFFQISLSFAYLNANYELLFTSSFSFTIV